MTLFTRVAGGRLHPGVLVLALTWMVVSTACGRDSSTLRRVPLVPIADAPGQHWKDISGTDYDTDFQQSYSYDDASVSLAYEKTARKHFIARLTATGLKPHFCYQVKLEGKPWAVWVYAGDDAANEALGYAGRWWRAQPEPREASDEEYEAHKDDESHVFSGFLLLDFFVTDENGDAVVELVSDGSYREVWKADKRERQPDDGPIREYDIDGMTVGVYAQREPGRAGPGEVALSSGSYNAQFSLTEEVFHDPDGGWARVMAADAVTFEIEPEKQD